MALNFPNNPAIDEEFTSEGVTFVWNGLQWLLASGDLNAAQQAIGAVAIQLTDWDDAHLFETAPVRGGAGIANAPFPSGAFTGFYTTQSAVNAGTLIVTSSGANGKTFVRRRNGGAWFDWIELTSVEDVETLINVALAGFAPGTHIGELPPAAPTNGQLWFKSGDPVGLFIYYEDVGGTAWVQIAGGLPPAVASIPQALAGTDNTVMMTPAATRAATESYNAGVNIGQVVDLARALAVSAFGTPVQLFAGQVFTATTKKLRHFLSATLGGNITASTGQAVLVEGRLVQVTGGVTLKTFSFASPTYFAPAGYAGNLNDLVSTSVVDYYEGLVPGTQYRIDVWGRKTVNAGAPVSTICSEGMCV